MLSSEASASMNSNVSLTEDPGRSTPAALFKNSFSIHNSRASRSRCRNHSRSLTFKAGSSPACSRRYAATQFPSVPSPMPSSRATAAIGRDPSITSFTASSRNCGEKFLFARGNCFPLQADQFYLVHLSGKTVAAQTDYRETEVAASSLRSLRLDAREVRPM